MPEATESLKEDIRALIAEIAEKDEIPDDTHFKDLGIDSMMGVEIVAAIERTLGERTLRNRIATLPGVASVEAV